MCLHKGKRLTGMVLNITMLEGKYFLLELFIVFLLAGNMLTINIYFQCLCLGVGERGSDPHWIKTYFFKLSFTLLYF